MELHMNGLEFADTIETIAWQALTEFYKKHSWTLELVLQDTFPTYIKVQSNGIWYRRLRTVENRQWEKHDHVLTITTEYMRAMYNLHHEQEFEFGV